MRAMLAREPSTAREPLAHWQLVSHVGSGRTCLAVDTQNATPGILARIREALEEQTPGIVKAILLECTELTPYSDEIRAKTGLPVYRPITNCDFVMSAFLENEKFESCWGWYKRWDGLQEEYVFGQHLSDE